MTEANFVYDVSLGTIDALNGATLTVSLVGPGYTPDTSDADTGDLADVIDTVSVECTVSSSGGVKRAYFDTAPSFDTTGVDEVLGFVVSNDDDGDKLVVFHEDPEGATPSNPYTIAAASGFAQASRDGDSIVTSDGGLPAGGTTGQVLTKISGADDDANWQDPTGAGIPDGGTTGQVLTKQSGTDGDADWEDPSAGGSTSFVLAPTQSEGDWTAGVYEADIADVLGGGTVLDGLADTYVSPGGLHLLHITLPATYVTGWQGNLSITGSSTGSAQMTVNGETALVPYDTDATGLVDILKNLNGIVRFNSGPAVEVTGSVGDLDVTWNTVQQPDILVTDGSLDGDAAYTPDARVALAYVAVIYDTGGSPTTLAFQPLPVGTTSDTSSFVSAVELPSGSIDVTAAVGGAGASAFAHITDNSPGVAMRVVLTPITT